MEDKIRQLLEFNILELETLYQLLSQLNLLNEQYVLDWLDKLNEISIR